MSSRKSSVDGFLPRRPAGATGQNREIGSAQNGNTGRRQLESSADLMKSDRIIGEPSDERPLGQFDIDESLRGLDDFESGKSDKKLSRREKKRLKLENRTRGQKIRRRIIKLFLALLLLLVLAGGAFFAYKTFWAAGSVFNGNVFEILQNEPLKKDENGRSNFLIVGTSEDDPGHDAGYLTDSIMIVSLDQTAKNAYMFSIPRDLYVDYGKACISGYRGKINEYFSCVNDGTDDAAEQDRLTRTQAFIGDIVGLDIQYSVHVNYTVMRDVVNAIGGSITVNIESRDPRGVMDSNFDWKCGASYYERIKNCPPDGHFIQYPNGEVTLDAEHALYLAQARGDAAPTYGFEQSNFDRERNQQKILVAIRDKAMSTGTLTNIGAVTGLVDALGNNLHTNIQTKEIRTLMGLAQDIPAESIQSIDLFSDDDPIFTTGTLAGAGSSVYPRAGVYDYSELRVYLKKQLSSDPLIKEEPHVMVLNGTETAGVAQTVADSLESKGFAIDAISNAPSGNYGKVTIYQLSADKTATAAKLKQMYGVETLTGTPPVSVMGTTDFVIIVGDASVAEAAQ